MGGVEPTRGVRPRELLERGISVVSANKQLLARHGEELLRRRRAARRPAALRGLGVRGHPRRQGAARVADRRPASTSSIGIVNGTTNFILTAMAREGRSYADALAEAQRLGYAEADPTEDVTGADAAAKVAILASIAFHTRLRIDDVPLRGHRHAGPRRSWPSRRSSATRSSCSAARGSRPTASWPGSPPRSSRTTIRWPASRAASTPSCCAGTRSASSRSRDRAPAAPRRPPP